EARLKGGVRAHARAGGRAGRGADKGHAGARVAWSGYGGDGILPVARAGAGRCVYGLRGRTLRGRSGTAIFVWVRGAGLGRRMALPLPLGARSRRGKESIRVACG